jgi:hypothetical protein
MGFAADERLRSSLIRLYRNRPMQTVGIDTNSTAVLTVRMSAPKTEISVGISSSDSSARPRAR